MPLHSKKSEIMLEKLLYLQWRQNFQTVFLYCPAFSIMYPTKKPTKNCTLLELEMFNCGIDWFCTQLLPYFTVKLLSLELVPKCLPIEKCPVQLFCYRLWLLAKSKIFYQLIPNLVWMLSTQNIQIKNKNLNNSETWLDTISSCTQENKTHPHESKIWSFIICLLHIPCACLLTRRRNTHIYQFLLVNKCDASSHS